MPTQGQKGNFETQGPIVLHPKNYKKHCKNSKGSQLSQPNGKVPTPKTSDQPIPTDDQVFQPQITFSSDPNSHTFYSKTVPIQALITENNPNFKQTVGAVIYKFVAQLVGQDFGPKIIGMLIDLPIKEIRKFCTNYDLFQQRVQQA